VLFFDRNAHHAADYIMGPRVNFTFRVWKHPHETHQPRPSASQSWGQSPSPGRRGYRPYG
jgi:hypothetical protein